MIARLLAPFRRFLAELRSWVDAQEGKRAPGQITFLRSKDGSIPFVRLPSGQVRSMKRIQRRAQERAAALNSQPAKS